MSEEILKKIKKLWDKANSAERIGSLAEAEAFFNKVNELLTQYNLSTVDLKNVKDEQSFITEEGFNSNSKGINWKFDFIHLIANINFCHCIWNFNCSRYFLIGNKTNIEITQEFINFIIPIVQILYEQEYLKRVIELREKNHVIASSFEEAVQKFRESKIWLYKNQIMPSSYKEEMKDKEQKYFIKDLSIFNLRKNKFIDSFTYGFAQGLVNKIKLEREKQKENIKEQTNALVIFYEEKINNFIEIKHPKVKSLSRVINFGSAYTEGYNKGNNFDLSKKVSSNSSLLLK